MKRAILFLAVFASVATAQVLPYTNETLVLTTATLLPQLSGRRNIEIQNNGPNAIYCALGDSAKAVVGTARKIASGATWGVPTNGEEKIYCITTVNQVTGAATVTTEVK